MSLATIVVLAAFAGPQSGQNATPPAPPRQERPRPAAVETGFLFKTLVEDGRRHDYCVYVPPEYEPSRAWPVILFLHGSGERGEDGLLQTDVGLPAAIRKNRRRYPAVVVMPQCRGGDVWWSEAMMTLALRCVEETSDAYHLDQNRIYVTGLSLGGAGAWHLGAKYARHVAAIVPVCGFADLGDGSPGVAQRLAVQLRGVPIWCFHGALDEHVPVQKSREMVAALRAAGATVQYTEIPDGGHFIWDQAYGDDRMVSWMLAQRRAGGAPENPSRPEP
jgi:predicted peptidase